MIGKAIAGVDFSGANKEPNDTWLAIGHLGDWEFQLTEIRKVGSHAISTELGKTQFAAVGIDCPFSMPVEFLDFMAQLVPRKNFQSWQEVAEHLVFMPFDDFLAAVTALKKEPKRLTDKYVKAPAQSPLHRGNPSMVQMTYQGMKLLARLDPKRFSVLPFQDASDQRTSVIEVYPREFLRFLALPDTGYKSKTKKEDEEVTKVRRQIIGGLVSLRDRKGISLKELIRLSVSKDIEHQLLSSDHALDAAIACYATALFATAPQLFSDPYTLDNADVLLEGWIYSLRE